MPLSPSPSLAGRPGSWRLAWEGLGIAAVGFRLLDSLPGVVDGIGPAGWLAAPAFVLALAFAVFAAGLLLRRPIEGRLSGYRPDHRRQSPGWGTIRA
jgi:hypothetical protein